MRAEARGSGSSYGAAVGAYGAGQGALVWNVCVCVCLIIHSEYCKCSIYVRSVGLCKLSDLSHSFCLPPLLLNVHMSVFS